MSYKVKKQEFFNWYFKETPKEVISAFMAPYLLNLVREDAHFSLNDLLNSIDKIPSKLVIGFTGKSDSVYTKSVELV